MSKRPLDRTVEEESEVTPKALRLGESGDKYETAEEMIHQQAVSDGHIEEAPDFAYCYQLVRNDPEVSKALQNAIDKRHYKDIMNLALTRYHADYNQKQPGQSTDVKFPSPRNTAAAQLAWSEPYRGNYHEILLMNINAMQRQEDYSTSVALIQSSGTGKSRMVDEQANLVFTIPFNLRNPAERMTGAYPPEDAQVRYYLCKKPEITSMEVALDRTTLFFGHLFSQVADEVQRVFSVDSKLSPNCLARRWRTHLLQGQKRSQLYQSMTDACTMRQDSNSIITHATDQSRRLLSVLAEYCNYPESGDVKVMLYFDEAHEFDYPIPGDRDGKTLYDVVRSSLNYFGSSFFTIFLSTQLSVTLLAPSAAAARSARQRDTEKLNAPITETPFDCHPSFPLERGTFKLKDLWDLRFLARFGRPLFWSMLERAAEDDEVVQKAMALARMKLVFDNEISKVKHSEIAMLAILDILITIDFEPRRDTADKTEMDMVASHMRTAFSVPNHRVYIRSGYPSEPFLAEAASRQMYLYMRDSPSRMISILKNNLNHGLIDLGQRGEVVMRVLLRRAYMDAIVAEQVEKSSTRAPQPNFSKGCSFLQFLKALFADRYHDEILNATPENGVGEHSTLKDAFKDAVVRFTHFVKAAENSGMNTEAMECGFVRGSAFICRNCQKEVDIIIPVLLDKDDTVAEPSMSALLIQVKRRKKAGSTNAYIIDQKTLELFPDDPTTQKPLRPYVTLLADLGVDVTSNSDVFDASHRPQRASLRLKSDRPTEHPKYALRAKGCTEKTWKVIDSAEHAEYIQLLGRDDLLDDHPRQNRESLQLVHQMLPFWYDDAAWIS